MDEFHIGDYVQIMCRDRAVFTGIIQDFTMGEHGYVILNGCGFPIADITVMVPA
jgi:hypothetical protein